MGRCHSLVSHTDKPSNRQSKSIARDPSLRGSVDAFGGVFASSVRYASAVRRSLTTAISCSRLRRKVGFCILFVCTNVRHTACCTRAARVRLEGLLITSQYPVRRPCANSVCYAPLSMTLVAALASLTFASNRRSPNRMTIIAQHHVERMLVTVRFKAVLAYRFADDVTHLAHSH